MSNKKKVNKRRHRSPWYKPFAKTETRLSARVTREEDWQTDVPNIRLSRAFVIVLLMHLVVGGALIAFTLMNPHEAKADAQAGAPPKAPDKGTATASADDKEKKAKTAGKAADKKPTAADKVDDMRRHIVHSGDSVTKIAQQYGVTTSEIYAVNRIDEIYQLYQGRVLRIPVSTSAPLPLNPPPLSTPFDNSSNLVTSEAPRTQTTAPRAEIAPPGTTPEGGSEPAESLLPEPAVDVSRPIVLQDSGPEQTEETLDIVRPNADSHQPDPVPATPPAVTGNKQYTVVKGDNPFRIAKKFGVSYKELLRHNGISNPNKLQIGRKLEIPNSN